MFKSCRNWLATLVVMLTSMSALAQTAFNEGEFQPYDEINVAQDGLTHSVRHRVLYFAHFTCPYCRQAHPYMEDWGDQLPPPYQLEIVPAIGLNEHIPMAVAYYVVLQAAPLRLREYEQALFSELQDRSRDPNSPRPYQDAAAKIGINKETFSKIAQNESTKRFVERARQLTERYGIQEVPTVVIANRFVTGPGRVYNEQQAFVSILNGLISMEYQERVER